MKTIKPYLLTLALVAAMIILLIIKNFKLANAEEVEKLNPVELITNLQNTLEMAHGSLTGSTSYLDQAALSSSAETMEIPWHELEESDQQFENCIHILRTISQNPILKSKQELEAFRSQLENAEQFHRKEIASRSGKLMQLKGKMLSGRMQENQQEVMIRMQDLKNERLTMNGKMEALLNSLDKELVAMKEKNAESR
jgi:hypothetical protein